jgi:hypothetical protein
MEAAAPATAKSLNPPAVESHPEERTLEERIEALDVGLFAHIESQTSVLDRASLLALETALAAQIERFSYLEIGSHLGGSLQVVLRDPRCASAISIDARPRWQPDVRLRGSMFEYPDNSTERMRRMLRSVPGADLRKLHTIDAGSGQLTTTDFAAPDLCFVDGEHTYAAVLRDARFCRAIGGAIIAFHDFGIVAPAVLEFLRETPQPRRCYGLRSDLFVVEVGPISLLGHSAIRRQLRPAHGWELANRVGIEIALAREHERLHRGRLNAKAVCRRAMRAVSGTRGRGGDAAA